METETDGWKEGDREDWVVGRVGSGWSWVEPKKDLEAEKWGVEVTSRKENLGGSREEYIY